MSICRNETMAQVYILYSEQLNKFYVGSCKDFSERKQQHMSPTFSKQFTKRANDWIDFLLIEDLEYQQAREIEAHIKSMKSSVYIRNLKKYPEIVEKLKLLYQKK
ncbi:MAG: hypothetical protein Fur0041_17710 [Bacteroidia bacterium]